MARTCAASWRNRSRASGSFLVMMRSLASRSSGRNRSHCFPSTSATSAALARPGPIDAATSAGVTPRANVIALPSGKVTVTFAAFGAETGADTGFSPKASRSADHREANLASQGGLARATIPFKMAREQPGEGGMTGISRPSWLSLLLVALAIPLGSASCSSKSPDSEQAILADCDRGDLPDSAVDSCLERARVMQETNPSSKLDSLIATLQNWRGGSATTERGTVARDAYRQADEGSYGGYDDSSTGGYGDAYDSNSDDQAGDPAPPDAQDPGLPYEDGDPGDLNDGDALDEPPPYGAAPDDQPPSDQDRSGADDASNQPPPDEPPQDDNGPPPDDNGPPPR